MNGELPKGWATAPLDDLLEPGGLFDGPFGSNLKTSDYTPAGVRVIRLENVGHLRFVEEKWTYISLRKYEQLKKHTVHEDDVIVGSFVDGAVRVCIVPHLSTKAIAKADCFCVRPLSTVLDRRFLMYQLGTARMRDSLVEQIHGATRPRITTRQLRTTELLVAPISEQRRIASMLDQLLTKLEANRQRLEHVQLIIERFRQSVLSAACSGQLTADWRLQEEDVEDVTAIIASVERRRRAMAVTPAQKGNLDQIFSVVEENTPEELPRTWRYATLAKLCTSFDYGTAAKSARAGKVPVLRMGNIQGGEIDWTNLVYTSDAREIAAYSLKPNTVLFNRTNSPELVGKTGIYRGERSAIFAGYLIRLNPVDELDSEYLNYCLNTPYARAFYERVKTDGVSQSNINARRLGTFEVPFCSIKEQREIVRKVRQLFSMAAQLQHRFDEAKARVEKVTPALLAKAFRGELVPTEAELAARGGRPYERAADLLAKIRAGAQGTAVPSARKDAQRTRAQKRRTA